MNANADSPIVEEVRRRRGEISKQFGDDVRAYGRYLRQQEQKHPERVVSQITVVRTPKANPGPERI